MEVLSDERCIIGEGPIWNSFNNKLYHVNGFSNEIRIIDIYTKEITIRKYQFPVCAVAFSKKGEVLISTVDGAFFLNEDGTLKALYNLNNYRIQFGNDAKVGPDGRFYIGTMSGKRKGISDKVDGKLYSIDKDGKVRFLLDNLQLSNGMEWSIDEKFFYHTDSDTNIIKEYSFNKETGDIAFTGREILVNGVDGFTIGEDGCLYVACWGQGHIAVVDTKTFKVKKYISVPAKIPASCCFAGENMEKFIAVTASYHTEISEDNKAGFTFITNFGIKGRKPYLFG